MKLSNFTNRNAAKPKIISNTTNENSTVAKLQVTRRTTTTRKTFLINNYNKMLESKNFMSINLVLNMITIRLWQYKLQ